MPFLIYKLPAVAYMALIFFTSSGPVDPRLTGGLPDFVLHAAAYLVMYLLVFRAVHAGFKRRPESGGHLLPLLITVLYGLSDELHQSFVPSRDASVRDLLADTAGALIGAAAVSIIFRSCDSDRGETSHPGVGTRKDADGRADRP